MEDEKKTLDEVAEGVSEVEENTSEAADEVKEEVSETAENAAAAAEDVSEEVQTEAEEVSETASEEAESVAEDATEEVKAEAGEVIHTAKEAPVIKKKRRSASPTVIILVVVIIIMALAAAAYVMYKEGVFKKWFPDNGKQTISDYSKIEVLKSDVEITDELVEQYITELLQSQSTTEEETKGVVADGDLLNIDYVGTLADTGEQFEGGTAQGQSLTIGSGQMIDGFESGLIGKNIGETVPVYVTFPEDYQAEDLAGKPAIFNITINSRTKTITPELTDDFVKEYSKNNLEKELKSVDELESYVYDYLYDYRLHNAMFEDLKTKQKVEEYNSEQEEMLKQYTLDSLDFYAAQYGTDPDQYAQMYGFETSDAYAEDEAHYYLDTIMLVDQIIKDKKIKWKQEDLDKDLELYMVRNGYKDQYTLDEFKEQSGETWLYLYENLEFKYNLALDALEDNVVFVDKKSTDEEPAAEIESSTPAAK